MKKVLLMTTIALCLCLNSCKKSEKVWTVVFKTDKVETGILEYRIRYLSPGGSEVQVGPLTNGNWESIGVVYSEGDYVFFEIEVVKGSGSAVLEILRDGALHKSGRLSTGQNKLRIEDNI